MTSLPSLFPSAGDGEGRWDVQRSCCKPAVGRPPRVQSLQRSVPKVLYFLPRAPDSTDLLATFGAEGRLPFFQPLIATFLQPAPPPLPHHGLQGLNPKQGSGEQGTGCRSPPWKPSASPEGWDHHWAIKSHQHRTAPECSPLTFPLGSSACCHLPQITAKSAFPAAGDSLPVPKGSPVLLLPTGLWPSPLLWPGRDFPTQNFTVPLLLAIWRMGFYFLRQTAGIFNVKFLLPEGKPYCMCDFFV